MPKDFKHQSWIHKANLHYIVNGKIQETIEKNVPYPIARKRKKELERSGNFRLGKLVVVSNREKES